jgi:hypothetical protein
MRYLLGQAWMPAARAASRSLRGDMSNEPSSFRAWLLRHVDEQTPIGDLARDARADDEWPEGGPESLQLYNEHLEAMNACQDALDVLEDAWSRYDTIRT